MTGEHQIVEARDARRSIVRRVTPWVRRLMVGRDVGWMYAGIVVAVQIALGLVTPAVRRIIVFGSATNLDNLHEYPPLVLVASAFVLAEPVDLLMLPILVYAYGVVQRWLGRAATVIMAVMAHVGATVFVATMLTARIHRGEESRAVASTADVGVSYGLAGMLGLACARLPGRWRRPVVAGVSIALFAVLLVSHTYSDLGHLTAWGIGVATAVLVRRGSMAGERERSHSAQDR